MKSSLFEQSDNESPGMGLLNRFDITSKKTSDVTNPGTNFMQLLANAAKKGINDGQNFDFQSPYEFLDGIKTKIDFENDLKFYKYQDSNSNSSYGVTSLVLRNKSLIEQFGGNKGKLHFFKNGYKFCDLLIQSAPCMQDLNGTIFCYVMRDKINQINWIDMSGLLRNGMTIGDQKQPPQREPFTMNVPFDVQQLQVTELRMSMLNSNQIKINMWSSEKFFSFVIPKNGQVDAGSLRLKQISVEEFNVEDPPIQQLEMGRQVSASGEPGDELDGPREEEKERVAQQIIDFGATYQDLKNDQDHIQGEFIVILDNLNQMHVFNLADDASALQDRNNYMKANPTAESPPSRPNLNVVQSRSQDRKRANQANLQNFEKIGKISYQSDELNFKTRVTYELLDAQIISTTKLIVMVKISEYEFKDNKLKTRAPTLSDITNLNLQPKQVFHEIQINQINQNEIVKKGRIALSSDQLELYIDKWKDLTITDLKNNFLFIPQNTCTPDDDVFVPTRFSLHKILNQKEQFFDVIDINYQILCDAVGANLVYDVKNDRILEGHIFSDYVVNENMAYFAHGKLVTIIDFEDYQEVRPMHVQLYQQQDDPFDMDHHVRNLFVLNKCNSTDTKQKVLALFNNGLIKSIERLANDEYEFDTSIQNLEEEMDLHKNYHYIMKSLGVESKDCQINGTILQTFTNSHYQDVAPYFLVLDKQHKVTLQKINIQNGTMSLFEIKNFTPNKDSIIMLDRDDKYQMALVIRKIEAKEGDQSEYFTRQKLKLPLNDAFKMSYGQIVNIPKQITNPNEAECIFLDEEDIYLVYAHSIVTMNTQNFSIESIDYDDYLSFMQICTGQYFYWRSSALKGGKYFPVKSYICFDKNHSIDELSMKSQIPNFEKHFSISSGMMPHRKKIYQDRKGETISYFSSFYNFQVIPFLHQNAIKLRNSGKEMYETAIIASQLFLHKLVTLHTDGTMREYNLKTGKQLSQKHIPSLKGYLYHQSIDSNKTLLRSKNFINPNKDEIKHPEFDNYMRTQMIKAGAKGQKRKKMIVKNIKDLFGIDLINEDKVKLCYYKIIEIKFKPKEEVNLKTKNAQTKMLAAGIAAMVEENESILESIVIEETMTVVGPAINNNKNYGLYIGDDLNIFIFYFKDVSRRVIINYYKIANFPNSLNLSLFKLKFVCQAKDTSSVSAHSISFKQYLGQNEFGQPHLYFYNQDLEKIYQLKKLALSESANPEKSQKLESLLGDLELERKRVKDINQRINKYIKKYNSGSLAFPTFINDDELLFMSTDNILFTIDIKNDLAEKSIITQCWFPGVSGSGKIELSTLIREKLNILGENCLVYEKIEDFYGPGEDYERIQPNFFNEYFSKDQVIIDKKADDIDEMRYIQINFKNKIQNMPRQQFGYIYMNKRDEYDIRNTEVRIVNTFNFFYWRMMNLLINKVITLSELSTEQVQELCYTQLPSSETFLHLIMRNQVQVKEMFDIAKEREKETDYKFFVPILEDSNEKNVLDYLFADEEERSQKKPSTVALKNKVSDIFSGNSKQDEEEDIAAIQQAGFYILEQIGSYPFFLFGIEFDKILPMIIKSDINRFCKFLDSRSKKLSFLENIDQGNVINDKVTVFTEHNLWQIDEKHLMDQTYETKKFMAGYMKLADIGPIDLKVSDIKEIHKPVKYHSKDRLNLIFDELQRDGNNDSYALPTIKSLIEVRWDAIWIKMVVFVVIPYIIFLVFFSIYTLTDLISQSTAIQEGKVGQSNRLSKTIMAFIVYFVIVEIAQIIRAGNLKHYITNIWNLCLIFLMTVIFVSEIVLIYNQNQYELSPDASEEQQVEAVDLVKTIRILYAICSILAWFRLLYFFRIMRSTGYYIRMVVEVLNDMANFILIFIIVVVAFAHALLLVARNDSEEPILKNIGVALSYSYLIPLGYYDLNIFPDYKIVFAWIFFVIGSFLMNITLLNLLISIISDTFGRIKASYEVIMYKDMLGVINENRLFYWGDQAKHYRGRYLYFANPKKEDSSEQIQKADRMEHQLDLIQLSIEKMNSTIKEMQEQEAEYDEQF